MGLAQRSATASYRCDSATHLNSIDFWRSSTVGVVWSWVVFSSACASGKSLSGQVRERASVGSSGQSGFGSRSIRQRLVCQGSNIATVIGVWPSTLGRGSVTRSAQVSHHPHTRPETSHFRCTWKGQSDLEVDRVLEAHLVP